MRVVSFRTAGELRELQPPAPLLWFGCSGRLCRSSAAAHLISGADLSKPSRLPAPLILNGESSHFEALRQSR